MTGGMAMFQSELRTAVRDAREAPMLQARAAPIANDAGRMTPTSPRELGAPEKRTVVRLWLPLTPLWILLAPFALLLAPILTLIPATRGAPPFKTALTLGVALIAMSGTSVDVDTRDALVRIRIF
ncbi:MAG TPA: hypothetical protein VN694_01370 [Caulobacteraceae bacterium]|nr:hypothetical protein [Caulobacteraceae bacterium]